MFPRVIAISCLSGAIIAGGCARQQPAPAAAPAVILPAEASASSLADTGRYAEAAAAWEVSGDVDARIRAALVWLDLGDMQRAREHWTPADPGSVAPTPHQALAQGLVELAAARNEDALYYLNTLSPAGFNRFEKGLFLRALGEAQLRAGDRAAVLNLLNAELFPLPAQRRTELTHLIWEGLTRSSDPGLAGKVDARNANLEGWFALKTVVSAGAARLETLQGTLADWQVRFPAHPANEMLIDEILERAERDTGPLRKVALILPLDGRLAAWAEAVRDGFNTMRLANADLELEVTVLSAEGQAVVTAYHRAVKDGARVVIGPLDKPGAEALTRLPELPVPLLVLNVTRDHPVSAQAASGALPAFTQFALTPEDEAADLAQRAWRDGHRRVATLVPNTDFGSRARAAFVAAWEQAGGTVIEDARYQASAEAYKAAIRKTFSLAQSEARAAFVRTTLNRPIHFEPRPRMDLDAIMLAADPLNARQILPQFRYLGVDHLPVYATAWIHSGRPDAKADADLDGVLFGARPWDLGRYQPGLAALFDRQWPAADPSSRQLFAFGMDAYTLLRELPAMAVDPARVVPGATGTLRRDAAGRVHRSFVWVRFEGGLPRAPAPDS